MVRYEHVATFARALSIDLQQKESLEEENIDESVASKGVSPSVLPYVPMQVRQTRSMLAVVPSMILDSLQDAMS